MLGKRTRQARWKSPTHGLATGGQPPGPVSPGLSSASPAVGLFFAHARLAPDPMQVRSAASAALGGKIPARLSPPGSLRGRRGRRALRGLATARPHAKAHSHTRYPEGEGGGCGAPLGLSRCQRNERKRVRTLQPVSSVLSVPRRDAQPTEFEVQAFLYGALRAAGVDCRGELQLSDKATRSLYRFDLVIFSAAGKAVEILEVKAAPIEHRKGLEATRQGRRYRCFGIPVTFIYGMADARSYLALRQSREAVVA